MMKTKTTTWLAQIAVMLVLLASGMASGATVFLSWNSPLGENASEAGVRQATAILNSEAHRACGDLKPQDAAELFVAPIRGGQAVDALMTGRRGGTVLSEARFAELQRMLRDEHNVILWIDREGRVLQEGQGALYRAYPNGPSFMYVRPGVTEYELAHESFHMFHHQALGQRYFMTGMDRTAANLIREQYVFDQMIESSVWNSLTKAEQQHAIGYIRSLGGNTRGMVPRGGP